MWTTNAVVGACKLNASQSRLWKKIETQSMKLLQPKRQSDRKRKDQKRRKKMKENEFKN